MVQVKREGEGPLSSRTRSQRKNSSNFGSTQEQLNLNHYGAAAAENDLETLHSIKIGRKSGDSESKDHAYKHRDELLQNLKDNIVQPLHKIKYYKIFTLRNCPLMINYAVIWELFDIVLLDIEKAPELEGREEYISHLWKLIFIIPTIFNSIIRD